MDRYGRWERDEWYICGLVIGGCWIFCGLSVYYGR